MINSVLRRIDAHLDEILAGSEVKELEHDIEFQLSMNAANNVEGFLYGTQEALLEPLAKKCNGTE